ncbi:pseudouridine synthase [Nitratifractor salsuginis]|uniref:Pseudouridine synthase n=1 Tax=Nitratifractor salsuginis (strain DSM 16511 / JCM 12458 / E9I37-1) TaxID=749222 RepID=E6WY83_NITSE|nr:pseudouridine synthase [Nitratifractor salsuginis]ADV45331.1 RNA-binding S4 domain protein [Nitratifractor salsuginis DSM 16511]
MKQNEEGMRLNKYISHNTPYSRRDADKLIEEGLVTVNRLPVKDFGYKVRPEDKVAVRGKLIHPRKRGEVTMVVYNKPRGVLVTKRDDRGRTTIYHKLPGKFRHFIPVGRLDYASEGLLLLTDNPEVADVLMGSKLPRTYNLKIDKPLTPEMEKAMKEGLILEDAREGGHKESEITRMEFAPFLEVQYRGQSGKNTKLRVTIAEGKNRELRRFFGHFGAKVLDLKRVGFGWVELNNLPENKTRYFTRQEYDTLHQFLKEARKND